MARKQLGLGPSNSLDATPKNYVDTLLSTPTVAYDATGTGAAEISGDGTITWSHTATGANRAVVVAVATGWYQGGNEYEYTTSCTYDGIAMTSLGAVDSGGNASPGSGFIELFYLLNPPAGNKTISAVSLHSGTPPATLVGSSVSYTGVVSVGVAATSYAITSTNISKLIPSVPKTYVVTAIAAGDPITSINHNQRYLNNFSANNSAGELVIGDFAGASPAVQFSASGNVTTEWALMGVTLYPYALEAGVMHTESDETINGIKTFDGSTTYTRQLWAKPNATGGTAALSLDNDNGQVWQETNNNGGSWALYDATNSKAPITVQSNSPDQALIINSAGVGLKSNNFYVLDGSDTTKSAKFDTSAISTGTINTYKLPDSSTTLIGASGLSGITVDTANEPLALTWNTNTSSQTTASFTPQAGTYVLIFVGIGTNQPTSSATVADSSANAFTKLSFRDTYDSAEIWGRYYATSPGSITVTATLTNAIHGGALKVRCLLGANLAQTGASANSGDFNQNVTITPTQNNSLIYGITSNFDGTNLSGTQLANTTPLLHYSVSTGPDDINFWRYNGITSANTPITVGYTQNGNRSNTIAFEVITNSVGVSTIQTLSNKTLTNPTITNYTESVVALGVVTTTSTINLTGGTVVTATLTASTACTFTMPTATAGKSFSLYLKQPAATGNGTATFSGVKWNGAGAPTITATAGRMDILSFVSDGSSWYGSCSQGYTY